jgi:hypothetical protein
MQDVNVVNGLGGAVHLFGNVKSVLGGEVLGDPLPSEPKKHYVNKLTNTLREMGDVQAYVAQMDWHMYAPGPDGGVRRR